MAAGADVLEFDEPVGGRDDTRATASATGISMGKLLNRQAAAFTRKRKHGALVVYTRMNSERFKAGGDRGAGETAEMPEGPGPLSKYLPKSRKK